MIGWIKLHRKLLNWDWYKKSEMVHLFIHMLLKANKEPSVWHNTPIEKGQFVTGLLSLSKETGLSVRTIRTCLTRLKNDKQIAIKTTNKYSIITICNYVDYQSEKGKNDKQNDKLTATNKKKEYILPGTKVPSLHTLCKNEFLSWYKTAKNLDYYWAAKDAGSLTSLINKLKNRAISKQVGTDDEHIVTLFKSFLNYLSKNPDKEKWLWDNLTTANLNSQFQVIIDRGKKK
jgi:hypothetical protein